MGKFARSARGLMINFDELEIKQALNNAPIPVSVDQRRQFINDKDGISAKKAAQLAQAQQASVSAMALAIQAAQDSIVEDVEVDISEE